MIKDIEGIVVSCMDYLESSKIVNVLTSDGTISLIVKGSKNIKNKNHVIGNMTYARFNIFYKEGKLSTLNSFDIINNFKNIRNNYDLINYCSTLINISKKISNFENSVSVYNILIDALYKIDYLYNDYILDKDNGTNLGTICYYKVIFDIVLIKYLKYLGVPIYPYCIKCGSDKVYALSSDLTFICGVCYSNEIVKDVKTIKYIKMFDSIDIKKICRISMDLNVVNEIHCLVLDYYERYTGIYIKKEFYE